MYLGQHQQRTKSCLARSRRVNAPLLPAFRLGSRRGPRDLSCARAAEAATAQVLKHAAADGGSFKPIALDPKTAEALRKKTEEPVRESLRRYYVQGK